MHSSQTMAGCKARVQTSHGLPGGAQTEERVPLALAALLSAQIVHLQLQAIRLQAQPACQVAG